MTTAILIALAAMSAMMLIMWVISTRSKNAGIVDVAWSIGTGVTAIWLLYHADGDLARRILLMVMIGIWSLRLTWHLGSRMMREEEDGRYQIMRKWMGKREKLGFFIFFQIQASWCLLFALPAMVAGDNAAPGLNYLDYIGIGIYLLAVIGEALSDHQLARFRKDPANKGKLCNVGLWQYTRHPNYFFEWLGWFAYLAIGWMGDYGAFNLAAPLIMYCFLRYLTGIPPTENRLIQSKGDAYRKYQQTTNALIPGPRRKLKMVKYGNAH